MNVLALDLLAFSAVFFLAYANGANDVSKAIATLVGSGVTDYRRAILWGTFCTVFGAGLAVWFSSRMVAVFKTGVIIMDQGGPTLPFAVAIAAGACGWVLLATRFSRPVSTTHALTGALVFGGAYAFGLDHLQWHVLTRQILFPLLASPLLAFLGAIGLDRLMKPMIGARGDACLCIGLETAGCPVHAATAQNMITIEAPLVVPVPRVVRATNTMCAWLPWRYFRVDARLLHWLSSGAVSVARGLNDAPKIVMIGVLFAGAHPGGTDLVRLFWVTTIAMGLGSLFGGIRVTETLAEKITPMEDRDGLTANLTTSALVTVAAHFGLPVSTTLVSSSAIVSIGVQRDAHAVSWNVVRDIALAWVVTLPAAGGFAMLAYAIARSL
ncbi:MAG: inorganic phosphate transporter [Candidatus Latescibacteria bacterium]|nr:inorganic phosphate transporter [Candidatus Latescibacterota bacterium]